MTLDSYLEIVRKAVLKLLKNNDKPKKEKLSKLQTRLSNTKKKTNVVQRVQKKVRK